MLSRSQDICVRLQSSLLQSGLFISNGGPTRTWRISPEPWPLSSSDFAFFSDLGNHLLNFYKGLNQLYFDSRKGKIPPWFAKYLDLGKPSDLLDYGRMNRFKTQIPGIIVIPRILQITNAFLHGRGAPQSIFRAKHVPFAQANKHSVHVAQQGRAHSH